MLWEQLSKDEQARLSVAHRERYHRLAKFLYHEVDKNTHAARAIARLELPNILHAAHEAWTRLMLKLLILWNRVRKFLDLFGFKQESEALLAKAQVVAGEVGSRSWYLAQSARGEQFLNQGRVEEAEKVFHTVLERLGEVPSYGRAQTLGRLGRCFCRGGRPDIAALRYQDAILVLDQLDQTDSTKRPARCLPDRSR